MDFQPLLSTRHVRVLVIQADRHPPSPPHLSNQSYYVNISMQLISEPNGFHSSFHTRIMYRSSGSQVEEAVRHAGAGLVGVLRAAEHDLPRRPGILLARHRAEEFWLKGYLENSKRADTTQKKNGGHFLRPSNIIPPMTPNVVMTGVSCGRPGEKKGSSRCLESRRLPTSFGAPISYLPDVRHNLVAARGAWLT